MGDETCIAVQTFCDKQISENDENRKTAANRGRPRKKKEYTLKVECIKSDICNVINKKLDKEFKDTVFTKTWCEYNDVESKFNIPIIDNIEYNKQKIGVPYVFLRTPLFAIQSKTRERILYKERTVIYKDKNVCVAVKGNSLTQHDLSVYMTVLFLTGKKGIKNNGLVSVPDMTLKTTKNDLQRIMGLPCTSTGRAALSKSIENLASTLVEITTAKYTYKGHLIESYEYINGGRTFLITADKGITGFYDTSQWSMVNISVRNSLNGNQLAQWLYSYMASHNEKFVKGKIFYAEQLLNICGSVNTNVVYFKHLLKNAASFAAKNDEEITGKKSIINQTKIQ